MVAWKQGLRWISWLAAAAGAAALTAGALTQERAGAPVVKTAELTGVIGPANAGYIRRAITRAERAGAGMLIIEMDTPGGLDTTMRDINRAILASEIPVAVFVHPSGARATSAGAYILYASHLAGMAPGTSVGAATPVQMGGGDEPADPPSPARGSAQDDEDAEDNGAARERTAPSSAQAMRNKVVNDSVAYIRSLAEMRGRNADWAEEAVREGVSASYSQALELGVIEIVAPSLAAFLEEADGREVTLAGGQLVTLALEGARIEAVEKTFAEEALAVITDPNIAFLLLNLGFIGLLVSFYNGLEPVTAIAGVIFIIIGFYALNTLPVNYAGAALIILGLVLLVSEAFFASSGLLALGGLAAFAIGSLMLMDTEVDGLQIDWRLIAGTTVALGAATFFLVSYGLAAQGRKVTTGDKALIGMTGHVVSWQDGGGYVMVDGERWRAESSDNLNPGDPVRVAGLDGLTLKVKLIK
ncbi:MAG: nodulation protein NfeD [Oceanicaulis sp.]|nr:nodulation protein NfeD [Oceanicaulis sp.]